LPVTQYSATLKVTAKGADTSTVTWSGTYTPDSGKEKDANDALQGIYESGLDAIKAKLMEVLGTRKGDLLQKIAVEKTISPALATELKAAMDQFKDAW